MSGHLRREVLKAFKELHKTRKLVFKEDNFALNAARQKINEEFKKNKHVSEIESVEEMVKLALGVELELRTRVVQAKEKEPGVYEMQIRPGIHMEKNAPFPPNIKMPASGGSSETQCCQQQKKTEKHKT